MVTSRQRGFSHSPLFISYAQVLGCPAPKWRCGRRFSSTSAVERSAAPLSHRVRFLERKVVVAEGSVFFWEKLTMIP